MTGCISWHSLMMQGLLGHFRWVMFRLPGLFGRLLLIPPWLMLTALQVVRCQIGGLCSVVALLGFELFGLVVLRFVRYGAKPVTLWTVGMFICIVILPSPLGPHASAQSCS